MIEAIALCIASIHDGDTIRLCDGERVRIENIDAPELRGSPACRRKKETHWCDYALGVRSRDALARFLRSGPARISRLGHDHYRRTLARVSVNGQDAGEYLISLGLARRWR